MFQINAHKRRDILIWFIPSAELFGDWHEKVFNFWGTQQNVRSFRASFPSRSIAPNTGCKVQPMLNSPWTVQRIIDVSIKYAKSLVSQSVIRDISRNIFGRVGNV